MLIEIKHYLQKDMSDQEQTESSADARLKEKLLQLSIAEEQVCRVLQLSADTCEELERLPFSDPAQLQAMSTSMIAALQVIRTNVVGSLDSIKPMDAQQVSTDSTADAQALLQALEQYK